MGEIFERNVPENNLAWTGERLTTGISGQVEIEHLHRYFFARALCRNLDVLDIASGEGYGSALLAQVAKSVVGIEISPEAVAHAQNAYGRPGLRFLQGDARRIGLEDNSVDAVVSFETIEHFYEHDAFIAEVRRVLRPGGIFIVSSPERDIYSPSSRPPNPYHVRELTRSEFDSLMRNSFAHVSMYAQRPLLGAAIIAEDHGAGAGPLITFERRGDRHFECSSGLPRALYLLAVASDTPLSASVGSIYIESDDIEGFFAKIRAAREEASAWHDRLLQSDEQAETWRQQVLAATEQAETWHQELLAANEQAEGWRQQLLATNEQAESWRQNALAANEQAENWRQKAVAASEQTETWRQRHSACSAAAEGLQRKLVDGRKELEERDKLLSACRAEAESLRQALLERDKARQELERQRAVISEITERMAQSEAMLDAVFRSRSWRVTAPLRKLSERNPAAVAAVRRYVAPVVRGLRSRSTRLSFEAVPGPEPVLIAAAEPAAEAELPPVTPPPVTEPVPANRPLPAGEPNFWFFLGDTLEWLEKHGQVTGVGRVTTELFFASLDDASDERMLPCVLGEKSASVTPISVHESVALLAPRVGTATAAELLASQPLAEPSAAMSGPRAGDHILFTGVVWTPQYAELFRSLRERGIGFSVFLYDIIPIEAPEFVSRQHAEMFGDWLDVILTLANVVFVSSPSIRDNLLRWAALSSVPAGARVVPVAFGGSGRRQSLPVGEFGTSAALSRVRANSFVLSVGTIDRRKNQALLCRVWRRLIDDLGRSAVPQLVLVGRDDLGISNSAGDLAELFRAGDIVVLTGVGDAELASLYENCLFTAFASLSEGYGLPVAESLEYGKLCVSSDLTVIREHAGRLPWYFDPADDDAAFAALRRAICDAAARKTAEAQIARDFRAHGWEATVRSMSRAVQEEMARFPVPPLPREVRPEVQGLIRHPAAAVMRTAREWCTDVDPEVSILIINWNAWPVTRECVRQIWANTEGVRYEIIIADNGSDPRDLAWLESLGSGVTLLALGTNRYFGEANNVAAERAKGRYVCLLNNDAFAQPGWLRHLLDALERDPEAGAAGPLFLFPDGSIQEAGAIIDENGYPVRFSRGDTVRDRAEFFPKYVDYISAAALLLPRALFMAAGGFDLAYEPAYYEDADLCFKLRVLGRKVLFVPQAEVIHIEGASANDDPRTVQRRNALGDCNRSKFVSRWGRFLSDRTETSLRAVADKIFVDCVGKDNPQPPGSRKTAAIFTPYAITPGGGERYLLTMASILARRYAVTLVTPFPYSHLRIGNICHDLGIDFSDFRLTTASEFAGAPAPDLMVAMGNHIVPPIEARARNSIFLCQFPFPLPAGATRNGQHLGEDADYRTVVAYSEYARSHIIAALSSHHMPQWPVEVVHPPAPQLAGDANRKRNIILSVGRFFAGGHGKQHGLLISAFRYLLESGLEGNFELHLAGSSMPEPMHMEYLDQLREAARDLPVVFHVNVAQQTLADLYRDAAVYWQGTGFGVDLVQNPEQAEHFGISIVEAMSAECVPVAFNAGGPREIITHGVNGFLYTSVEELAAITREILSPDFVVRRRSMAQAASRRAAAFSADAFAEAVWRVVEGCDVPALGHVPA